MDEMLCLYVACTVNTTSDTQTSFNIPENIDTWYIVSTLKQKKVLV